MNVTIQFSRPYQRFQLQNTVSSILVLPASSVVTVRNESRDTELMVNVDAKLDTIDAMKISGFNNRTDLAAFIQSIPNDVFTRISRMTLA